MNTNPNEISSRSGDRRQDGDGSPGGSGSGGGNWRAERHAAIGTSSTVPGRIGELLGRGGDRGGDSQSEGPDIVATRRSRLGNYIKYQLKNNSLTAEGLLAFRVHKTTDQHIKALNIHRRHIIEALANHLHLQLSEYDAHPEIYPPSRDVVSRDRTHFEILARARECVNSVREEIRRNPHKEKKFFGDTTDERNDEFNNIVDNVKNLHRMMRDIAGRTPTYDTLGDASPLYHEVSDDRSPGYVSD